MERIKTTKNGARISEGINANIFILLYELAYSSMLVIDVLGKRRMDAIMPTSNQVTRTAMLLLTKNPFSLTVDSFVFTRRIAVLFCLDIYDRLKPLTRFQCNAKLTVKTMSTNSVIKTYFRFRSQAK